MSQIDSFSYEIEDLEKVLDLMIQKKVAGFELNGFKVTFMPQAFVAQAEDEERRRNKSPAEQIDEDLGFEWEK